MGPVLGDEVDEASGSDAAGEAIALPAVSIIIAAHHAAIAILNFTIGLSLFPLSLEDCSSDGDRMWGVSGGVSEEAPAEHLLL
ncbi:hypothetical protein HMPREF9306_01093 [Propionimicrobium lymphophilum ACS-093-V-SCH5]|uniref:Uncharacterized protein n=1 Tax=Propionimicrobium lymphophilum ACS-093-V-SCH5 TaxID=883161 RepID=S2W0Y2_9ACTN|nr:hypothetical protein HMPREF9306_01093 [Propionimicrobium lymphophilum ACS-093-V-SCH5]